MRGSVPEPAARCAHAHAQSCPPYRPGVLVTETELRTRAFNFKQKNAHSHKMTTLGRKWCSTLALWCTESIINYPQMQKWRIRDHHILRKLADTDFASVQNFVKLGLYLKQRYDKQQASWEVLILKFKNWVCLRKLHRSGLDLLSFFQVLPSSAMVLILSFGNSWSQNERSLENILPKLDFTKILKKYKMPVCRDSYILSQFASSQRNKISWYKCVWHARLADIHKEP